MLKSQCNLLHCFFKKKISNYYDDGSNRLGSFHSIFDTQVLVLLINFSYNYIFDFDAPVQMKLKF